MCATVLATVLEDHKPCHLTPLAFTPAVPQCPAPDSPFVRGAQLGFTFDVHPRCVGVYARERLLMLQTDILSTNKLLFVSLLLSLNWQCARPWPARVAAGFDVLAIWCLGDLR